MGNIIAMLYMGSRVYLSLRNPAYNFFIRNGISVNIFEKEFGKYGVTRPDKETVENNRKRLDRIFNKDKVLMDLKNLIVILTTS